MQEDNIKKTSITTMKENELLEDDESIQENGLIKRHNSIVKDLASDRENIMKKSISYLNSTVKEEITLAVFKKLPSNTLLDTIQIPERPENRVPTDRKFLIIFFVIVIILFPFLIYCMITGDLARVRGYDQCGNVCGKKNSKYDQWDCTGKDFTDYPLLQFEQSSKKVNDHEWYFTPRKCVQHCESGYQKILSYCYRVESTRNDFGNNDFGNLNSRFKRASTPDESLEEIGQGISDYLSKHAWRIVLACFVSLGVAIIMLVLFKTATAAVVWGILGGVLLFGAIIVGGLWYVYFNIDKWATNSSSDAKNNKQPFLFMAIFFTVMLIILFCVMVFMYKKVQLVIQLLKEATKAAFAMPLLIFVPIITFFSELIILALLVFTSVFIFTSGTLTELYPEFLYYKENVVMTISFIFNLIVAFWATQFIIGIQYMVIAGAVARWYWSKNKNNLDRPITDSASIVFKFHLGSIALGSLVITIIAIIRALLTSLTKNRNLKACVDFCIGAIESFLKFLSKNSYILTAMHGKPFYKSGKRAAKIIFQNVVNISAVNYVGDFVLGMAQLLIVLISLLITVAIMQGAESEYSFIIYLIVFFVSLFIAITFFAIFETTIDTIFLCFCEDSLLNDGMARPYAMSRDLMEFVENSKKLYGDKKN